MSKFVFDADMDALLNSKANNVDELHICSGDPADRASVITNSLASIAVGPGDFTLADGDVSGRKDTLQQKAIPSASASGTAAVLCLINATELRYKTDLASTQAITAGNPVTVNSHSHEVRDPI